MGKTAFTGPAFGAQQLLWSVNYTAAASTGSSGTATLGSLIVPAYTDWYITSLNVYRSSTHSTAMSVSLTDDSSVVVTCAVTSSLASQSTNATPTTDPGEYLGKRVAAGSSLSITMAMGGSTVTSSAVGVWVYGYQRWVPSTVNRE